jgi:hypothetical protein
MRYIPDDDRATDLFSITISRDGFWIKINEQRISAFEMSHWFLLGISKYGPVLKIANRDLINRDWSQE